MSGKNINFDDKKANKSNFYKNRKNYSRQMTQLLLKSQFLKKKRYVKKSSLKYFIGYNDNDDIRPLCIKLPQMIGYAKYFNSDKTISFKVIDKGLLKRYTRIWGESSSLIGKEFDGEPIYGDNDKYIKTKIKSYEDKVNINFQGKKYQKKMHHASVSH